MTRPILDAPSRRDNFIAGLSQLIGGPIGDHFGGGRRYWTALRVIIAIGIGLFVLQVAVRAHCPSEEVAAYRQVCYTDIHAAYKNYGLDEGLIPYQDTTVDQPVGTGVIMGIVGLIAPDAGSFSFLTAVLLLAALLCTIILVVQSRPARMWDAAMVAAAPVLFVVGLMSWDLVAVALTVAALYSWSQQRLGWAGIFLGLAAAVKFYPLLLLYPLFLLAFRARRMPEFVITFCSAFSTWVAVNLPIYLLYPHRWSSFYAFSQEREISPGSFWYLGSHFPFTDDKGWGWFAHFRHEVGAVNDWSVAMVSLALIGIAALIFFAPKPPRVAACCFLVVACFLLFNKVWSPQYALWLLPLLALARPRWGIFAIWQATEVVYFFAWNQFMVDEVGGISILPTQALAWAGIARWLAVFVLCILVVRDALAPSQDEPRMQEGGDDPDGGVLVDRKYQPVEEPA